MRVLTILEILQAKGRVTASELAARLEVSSRTVQRYIARLQDLGVPVTSTRGRGAEYRLKSGFRMPPILFSNEEAFAVALGLNALQHLGLTALAPAVVGVETKLERVVPTAIWSRVQALSAAVHLERSTWLAPVDSGLVAELTSAIEARLQIDMQYENYRGVRSHRTVQPFGLVRDGGAWFLAAYCLLRQDSRLFRVDRIITARRMQVAFEQPDDFDARAFVEKKLQDTPAKWHTEVWLESTPETLRYDLLPPRASISRENGGMILRCGVDDLEQYAARLLAFNCRLELRSPPELKLAFRGVSERAMQIFQRHELEP